MTKIKKPEISRRQFAASAAAFGVAAPGILRAQEADPAPGTVDIRVNNYSFRSWKGYFSSLRKGAILVDTKGRTLHYWPEDEAYYKVFPVSVPLTPDLTRFVNA